MSTKALRECLEYMKRHHGQGMMEDAQMELEAIERAAKVLDWAVVFCGAEAGRDDFDAMYATVASIAKDAP